MTKRLDARRLSVILIDWKVRESFHALDFLNRQTVAREEYELIWVEHYDHRPEELRRAKESGALDRWIVLGRDGMYFKHQLYNEGLASATGEIVCVCDSDAAFPPTFVESVLRVFEEHHGEQIALYLEEVRSDNRSFYPFPKSTTWEAIMAAPGLMNWDAERGLPKGLAIRHDRIHNLNYGACFLARRDDAIAAGGFDEHEAYHCFMCGPYELGLRLVNAGAREIWHEREWLLHTWHPWVRPEFDVMGPHDGRGVNTLALENVRTGRVMPLVENARIRDLRGGATDPGRPAIPLQPAGMKLDPRRCRARSPRVKRLLVVAELAAAERLGRTLEATGLAIETEVFFYDAVLHKFDRRVMQKQLLLHCRHFRPDLIVCSAASDREAGPEVEPDLELFAAAAHEGGSVVYLHEPSAESFGAWAEHVDFIGVREERSAPRSVELIRTLPEVSESDFHDAGLDRNFDVLVAGPIRPGGRREETAWRMMDADLSVHARLHAYQDSEQAGALNRSVACVNIADGEEPERIVARALEALACGCVLMQDPAIELPSPLAAGEDFIAAGDTELPEAVAAIARDEERRLAMIRSAARKIRDHFGARSVWARIMLACGFDALPGGIALRAREDFLRSRAGVRIRRAAESARLMLLKRVAIFGAGPSGVGCLQALRAKHIAASFFLDNAPDRQGKTLMDLPIHPIASAAAEEIDGVVIAFQGKKNLARYQLAELGYRGAVIDFDLIR